jgi:Domain of unknown function (DUF4920)
MSCLRFVLPLVALVGCAQEAAKPTAPTAVPPAPKPAAVVLGEPISAASVALTDIAKNPRSYEGRALATSGVVTAVCQNMGCWMEIEDEASNAHIRMHGHSFFIPKSASGRHARVQATLIPKEDAKECDESPSHADPSKTLARVELDATGVELD